MVSGGRKQVGTTKIDTSLKVKVGVFGRLGKPTT